MLKPARIVVPTDFSGCSNATFKQAVDMAEEYGAEVYVLHVVEPKTHTTYEYELSGKNASPEGAMVSKTGW